MRRIASLIVLVACIAGASFAQETVPPTFVYRWEEQPGGQHYARRYPRPARNRNISGAAVMCCTVNEDRRLDCTVPFEWPADSGFADATLAISREFRLTQESYAEVRGTPRAQLRRMIRWQMGNASPDLESVYARISDGTQSICEGTAVPVS